MFRRKEKAVPDCEHCKKLEDADKQASFRYEQHLVSMYDRRRDIVRGLIAENEALHRLLEAERRKNEEVG